MAGAAIPASGDISDSGNTTAEQKSYLEDLVAVLRRIAGVGDGNETATISGGAITGPIRGILKVANEGGAGTDILDTIDLSNYRVGSVIVLQPATGGNTTTLNHGVASSGGLVLDGSVDFDLTGERRIWLQCTPANRWNELYRSYGSDVAGQRAYLGLGTAATHDAGPGNGLDADTLDGQHAAAFLGVAAKAADSELLDGINSTDFVRKSVAAQQDLAHNLKVGEGRFIADDTAGQTSGIEMHIGGSMLARCIVDDQASDTLALELMASAGGALHRGVRVVNGASRPQFYNGSSWIDVAAGAGSGSNIDADLVHGVSGESLFSTGGVGEYTTSWAAGVNGTTQVVTMPASKMCFAPRCVTDTVGVNVTIQGWMSGIDGIDDHLTKFLVTTVRSSGTTGSIEFRCRYIPGDPPLNF